LQLYATRDKQSDLDQFNPFITEQDLLDDQETGGEGGSSKCNSNKNGGRNHRLLDGRHDWEEILSQVIQKAHDDNLDEGMAVGGFFFVVHQPLPVRCKWQQIE
jgi:hypothetical protein